MFRPIQSDETSTAAAAVMPELVPTKGRPIAICSGRCGAGGAGARPPQRQAHPPWPKWHAPSPQEQRGFNALPSMNSPQDSRRSIPFCCRRGLAGRGESAACSMICTHCFKVERILQARELPTNLGICRRSVSIVKFMLHQVSTTHVSTKYRETM